MCDNIQYLHATLFDICLSVMLSIIFSTKQVPDLVIFLLPVTDVTDDLCDRVALYLDLMLCILKL